MDHPISPWSGTHSVWVLVCFPIRGDGLSSFHRRYGEGTLLGLAEFGGTLSFKAHENTSPR